MTKIKTVRLTFDGKVTIKNMKLSADDFYTSLVPEYARDTSLGERMLENAKKAHTYEILAEATGGKEANENLKRFTKLEFVKNATPIFQQDLFGTLVR